MSSVSAATKTTPVPKGRDMFATKFGVIIATLGSAVGLGNIWKFPYLTGVNGGAAFVILYILCTLVVGLPVMITEHSLGRTARADAIQTFKKLAPNSSWWLVSGAGVVSAFLIMAFYTEVAGWVFAYIAKAVRGSIQLIAGSDFIGFFFAHFRSGPVTGLPVDSPFVGSANYRVWRGQGYRESHEDTYACPFWHPGDRLYT